MHVSLTQPGRWLCTIHMLATQSDLSHNLDCLLLVTWLTLLFSKCACVSSAVNQTKLSLFPHLGDSMFLRSSSICPQLTPCLQMVYRLGGFLRSNLLKLVPLKARICNREMVPNVYFQEGVSQMLAHQPAYIDLAFQSFCLL